jgi:hypothetical protein
MYYKKSNRRPYTETDLAEIRQLANEGHSRLQIAKLVKRTPGSINGICVYYDINTHGGRTPHDIEQIDGIRRMRGEGITQSKIAKALDMTFDTVHSLCARHVIKKPTSFD